MKRRILLSVNGVVVVVYAALAAMIILPLPNEPTTGQKLSVVLFMPMIGGALWLWSAISRLIRLRTLALMKAWAKYQNPESRFLATPSVLTIVNFVGGGVMILGWWSLAT